MKPVWSLFPKSYREYNVPQLAELVRAVGLDTTNVIIRKGFQVEEDSIKVTLPKFVHEARDEGLAITCASTTYRPDEICGPDSHLPIMADAGIKEFRMGWFPKAEKDVHAALKLAKGEMDQVAEACQKYRIRAIYQVHHNTLITSPSAAYNLVRGLPCQWIGIELDPGNQSFQGFEPWDYSVGLLADFCAWAAVKDTVTWQEMSLAMDPDKGWRRRFAPISEGVTNWRRFVDALKSEQFDGTVVFMPFYEEESDSKRTEKLAAEVRYLRQIWSI